MGRLRVGPEQVKEAVWMWALKQSMELAKIQNAQTLQTATSAPVVSEPGKGTVIDVRL
ncbi:MAG TPA: hypothetical protein VD902_22190 [Symbiobacteriaceae bacterium]|nr:hypothetical protein [Symbiobacteriaceae bacterium]